MIKLPQPFAIISLAEQDILGCVCGGGGETAQGCHLKGLPGSSHLSNDLKVLSARYHSLNLGE